MISKNVYTDIINKHNDTHHRAIKMRPIDVKVDLRVEKTEVFKKVQILQVVLVLQITL